MRRSRKLLASILVVALLVTSAIHALADENANGQVPVGEEITVPSEGQVDSGSQSDVPNENTDDAEESLCDLDDSYGCCNGPGELDLENAQIIEVEVDYTGMEDYERMDLLYIAFPVLHTPDEQWIAVFFEEEEMVLTEATLHTRSLTTGEVFSHPYYMMIENTVSFVIYHEEGSGEDEILLVSIEYLFEGQEEPVVVEFYDHNIEASYTVTNQPLPGMEESGIVVHGFAEDGEVISEETDIYNISEAIEEIMVMIDDEAVPSDSVDDEVNEASPMGIAPMSSGVGINPTTAASNNRIIVVSAGHCSTHAGAVANGLLEHELTWHVAGVVVNELNTFAGITAIRDRPTIHCRWPGGGWQRCVTERVHQARRDGASIFVDIHFNASTNPAAHGAEIWIPNTSRNDGMNQAGRALSNEILRRLSVLGMHNRGHRTVSDGQLEFASNRIARELGMLGILVEGGFLTNTADANRLRDPNFRHRLGVEIARGIATVDIGNIGAPPQPIVSTTTARDTNGQETFFDLRTAFSSGGTRVGRVRFAVWGEVNGQNDLRWLEGTRNADGSWGARVDIRNHRESGRYQVHTWVITTVGQNMFTSATTFNVTALTGGTIQVVNSNPGAGTFDVRVSGVNSRSGVAGVRFPVWSRADRSDIVWYTGVRQSDGSFRATVRIANHNFNIGTYQVHAHVTSGNGQLRILGTTHDVSVRPQATVAAVNRNGTEILYDLTATNVELLGNMTRVRFAVWSEHNGQNDLIWYNGVRQANGSWTATADVRRHRYTGRYQVHVWGTRQDGSLVMIGTTTFSVSAITGGIVQVVNQNLAAGTFDVKISGVNSPSGIAGVRFPVWSRADRSDMRWYTGVRQGDGSFRATVSIANHNFNIGTYHVHAHVTTGNGQLRIIGTTHNVPTRPHATVTATNRNGTEILYDLRASNVELVGNFTRVQFAVWSEHNGQNDLIWYTGVRQANGSWMATADVRRHRYTGRYQVHAWGTRQDGSRVFIGATTFNVSAITGGAVQVMNSNLAAGTFVVSLSGVNSPSGVTGVRFPVWSRADRSDMRWYTGVRQSDGSFRATVNVANHNYNIGTYHIHAHVTTGNGQLRILGTTHHVPTRPTVGLISIMGTSQTNVAQMVRNYRNSGHTFPAAALGMSLETFAQNVFNEANREGVRAEVLWTQVMRETGWLQFGGDVRINQFNFGGLGATGGGNPGHSFPSVQIGLRAQVHHLVAYATTAPVRHPSNRAHPIMRTSPPWGPTGQTVVNGTESPRFHFVARGISPYVNWLGQGENPNHPGFWAADRNYGAALAAAIRVLLSS